MFINFFLNDKKIVSGRRKLGVVMGDNTQTGVNSMFDVGCIVGNNVFVGPGAFVSGEIKKESKVF